MPQIVRLDFSAERNVLIHLVVVPYVGCLDLVLLAASRTSAARIVQRRLSCLQTPAAMSVNRAAIFGLRLVGCVKWLASFHGAIVCTSGRRARKARTALRYCAALGSRHCERLRLDRLLQISAAPRACSKVTRTSVRAALAALRYGTTLSLSSLSPLAAAATTL